MPGAGSTGGTGGGAAAILGAGLVSGLEPMITGDGTGSDTSANALFATLQQAAGGRAPRVDAAVTRPEA